MLYALAKKKDVRHYIDLITKVFEEHSDVTRELPMPISDVQGWG